MNYVYFMCAGAWAVSIVISFKARKMNIESKEIYKGTDTTTLRSIDRLRRIATFWTVISVIGFFVMIYLGFVL